MVWQLFKERSQLHFQRWKLCWLLMTWWEFNTFTNWGAWNLHLKNFLWFWIISEEQLQNSKKPVSMRFTNILQLSRALKCQSHNSQLRCLVSLKKQPLLLLLWEMKNAQILPTLYYRAMFEVGEKKQHATSFDFDKYFWNSNLTFNIMGIALKSTHNHPTLVLQCYQFRGGLKSKG